MAQQTSIRYELQYPINVAGAKVSSLNLRYMTCGDMRKMTKIKDDTEKAFFLIQQLSELAPDEFDQLAVIDMEGIQHKLVEVGFLPNQSENPTS